MQKLVITVAVNGSLTTKEMNPNVPVTPREIGEVAARCREAGAAMVHTHARDENAKPSLSVKTFQEVHHAIVSSSDMIAQLSTGGRADMDIRKRGEATQVIKPEMASLTTGSVNFPDQVYINSESDVEYLAGVMKESGTKPEMEIFESGMIANAVRLAEKGLVQSPIHFDFVMGMRGGQTADARTLLFLSETIPAGSTWTVAALGRYQLPMAVLAIVMGGHVRVGLEDNLYLSKGVLASNEQLVERIARLSKELGREIASPDEARTILGIGK